MNAFFSQNLARILAICGTEVFCVVPYKIFLFYEIHCCTRFDVNVICSPPENASHYLTFPLRSELKELFCKKSGRVLFY